MTVEARLRTMERFVACHRAYEVVEPIAADFIEEWESRLDLGLPLPDYFELVRTVTRQGIAVLATRPVSAYVEQCAVDRRSPNLDRLTETLVHGFAETRLNGPRTCRCQRKRP